MLNFTPLDKNVLILNDYASKSKTTFCDITLGTKFMWRDEFRCEYAIYKNTLILRESCFDYKEAYYFPMGENKLEALTEIEKLEKNKPFSFCAIDNATASYLAERYSSVQIIPNRDWSDYIYDAKDFISFSGKKFGGQRNHVNKFKRLYPDYQVKILDKSDLYLLQAFLDEFKRGKDFSVWSEIAEQNKVYEYAKNLDKLNNKGACILVDGKIIAISMGEVLNDTLYVHVEKGLKEYDGVYPTMANEFAKAFAGEGVKFINREEDCGDMGLRISKLQYHPLYVKEKNIVKINTLFEKIPSPLCLKGDRIQITEIYPSDKQNYFALCSDEKLNEFWGYDYKEDLKGEPTEEYFIEFKDSLIKEKSEHPFAIRLGDKLIGEITLHNFSYFGEVEMGFRLLPAFSGQGYCLESALIMRDFVFNVLGAKRLKCKCYKNNVRSKNLILKLGLKEVDSDKDMLYFEL